jgi:transposase-like protein
VGSQPGQDAFDDPVPRQYGEAALAGGLAHDVNRDVNIDHTTVFRWVQQFTPLLIDAARPCRHASGNRWFVDETTSRSLPGESNLYRAIDHFSQVIDVLASEKRDLAANRRFFTRAAGALATPGRGDH